MGLLKIATKESVKDTERDLPLPVVVRLKDKRCYKLIECYCDNPKCDNRTAIIEVYDSTPLGEFKEDAPLVAVFEYKWSAQCETLNGSCRYTLSSREGEEQSDIGKEIQDALERRIETDPLYCQRLYKHYHHIKESLSEEE